MKAALTNARPDENRNTDTARDDIKPAEKKDARHYLKYVLMYGCYYFAMAIFSVLISVYMMDKGLNAVQVSLIVSASYLMSMIVQPLIGIWQDRGNKKKITVILLALSALTGTAFLMNGTFYWMLAFYGITVTLLNAANPYIEKVATISNFSYRSIRIWGTFGYGFGAQIAGVIYDRISPDSMYYLFSIMILLAAVGVWGAKGLDDEIKISRQSDGHASEYRKALLVNPKFLLYILIAALFYAATSLNSTYIPMLYQQAGVTVSATSTVIFIGTLMELPIIFFASAYMNRFSGKQLLLAVFCMLVLQFAVYAFAPWTMAKAAATILLKSSVTMMYIMLNIKVVSAIVSPRYQMSALTLVSALSRNLITIGIQNLGGTILNQLSVNALYVMLVCLALAGLALSAVFKMPREQSEIKFN